MKKHDKRDSHATAPAIAEIRSYRIAMMNLSEFTLSEVTAGGGGGAIVALEEKPPLLIP